MGRYSNELGKPTRLELGLDDIQAPRELVQQAQSPMQRLLCLMIEYSVESLTQRRYAGKPDSARLFIKATHSGALLRVTLEDDGAGLNLTQIASVAKEVRELKGSLSLVEEGGSGTHISLNMPCASVRWDIASKSL